ncbi:MAG: 3-oxoacyl-ACP synthase [Chlamydiae bacterium SM23_39]|nr:MAG: 3-oxoacyl-ACP synthase [Chlamydiae bacterium SM23_39]
MKKRIVVTGMGVVSCFGNEVEQYFNSLLDGKSGIIPIEKFPCEEYSTRFAAYIKNFDAGDYIEKKRAKRADPFICYAMVAGKKAIEDAKISLEEINKDRAGIIIGSGIGGMRVFSEGVLTVKDKGYKRLTPFFVPFIITNMAGALLAIDLGFYGPNYSISTACATSNYSILSAAEQIKLGNADIMLCGGSEAPIFPIGLSGFIASKVLSSNNDEYTKASRPWDKERDGFVMGEGCGVLVLEELQHALKRKAKIYGEYLGGSKNCDAYSITNPREDGEIVRKCIEYALLDANVKKEEVNYINAHATSTVVGDLCEIKAIKKVFGSHLKNIKINATKSMIGHCLGAAGAMEAIALLKSIEKKKLHPTINLQNPEEEIEGIDVVRDYYKDFEISVALSNSFGFGGHNCVLVFSPYKG